MIRFQHQGDYSKVTKYFKRIKKGANIRNLEQYARQGVDALMAATPVDTGLTATSWYYEIKQENGRIRISFCNSNIQNGVPIAIILQYGHATRNGGWVEGRDYINPAIQPVFDEITKKAWKEVSNL